MKVAWVCEYPIAPALSGKGQRAEVHPVPWVTVQAPLVAASGVELHIVTVSKRVAHDEEFIRDGVRVHVLKVPKLPRAALLYRLDRRRIVERLRRIGPALVHGFGTESSFGY